MKAITVEMKSKADSIQSLFAKHHIICLYHFTDRSNLPSIERHGGLFSWFYLESNGIKIANPGGDSLSRSLDRRYGLEDYVRLSFCSDHPMAWRKKQEGANLVLLRISLETALFKDTLFTDSNAASSSHSTGGDLAFLKSINLAATQRSYVRRDDPDFHAHQAEVMVRTFIPVQYILNLSDPMAA